MELSTSEPTSARFDALYRETASDVFAYVMTLLRDRATAEDVTAAAFERAYRRQATFDARRGTRRAWLFGIARNAALDELRRRRRTAALLADPQDTDAPGTAAAGEAEEAEEAAVRRAAVRAALAALDPRDRELIALKFHAGLSNAEIARVLGVSESNAGTRVHRAVTRLRKACHAPS
jgi:RNA polymerase sigma-70 factor (ECF subfamily)